MTKLDGELISMPAVGGIGVKIAEKNLRLPVKVTIDTETGEVVLKVDPQELKKIEGK